MVKYLFNRLSQFTGVIIISLLSVSCSFEPEEFFIEIPSEIELSLDRYALTNYSALPIQDTFQLYGRFNELNFVIDFSKEIRTSVDIIIDNELMGEYEGDSITFYLWADNYSDGYHSLILQPVTSSGTGSLADSLEAELIIWEPIEWIFFIKREAPDPITITNIAPEDGYLSIEWESGNVPTEKRVEFTLNKGFSDDINWSYLIRDPMQTQLLDSFYIGGDVSVRIINQSIDPSLASPVDEMDVSYAYPTITGSESDGYGTLVLSLDMPFSKAVETYRLIYNDTKIGEANGNFSIISTDSIRFWTGKSVSLSVEAKNLKVQEDEPYVRSVNTTIRQGELIDLWYETVRHAPLNPSHGFAIYDFSDQLVVFTNDKIEQIFSVPNIGNARRNQTAISTQGDYFYYALDGTIYSSDRAGNITSVLSTEAEYGQKIGIGSICIGGDRFLTFNDKLGGADPVTTYLYDLELNQPIADVFDMDGFFGSVDIKSSTDGKYLMIHDLYDVKVFEVSPSALVKIKEFKAFGRISDIFFDKDEGYRVIMPGRTDIYIYDIPSEATSTLNIPTEFQGEPTYSYDILTGMLGAKDRGYYRVIDPETGEDIRKILIDSFTSILFLYNGSIHVGYSKYDLKLTL